MFSKIIPRQGWFLLCQEHSTRCVLHTLHQEWECYLMFTFLVFILQIARVGMWWEKLFAQYQKSRSLPGPIPNETIWQSRCWTNKQTNSFYDLEVFDTSFFYLSWNFYFRWLCVLPERHAMMKSDISKAIYHISHFSRLPLDRETDRIHA